MYNGVPHTVSIAARPPSAARAARPKSPICAPRAVGAS